jgi:uncharacterized membrane protein (UPF0127 family)
MERIQLTNQTNPLVRPLEADYCDAFICRLRGLMFTDPIDPWHGLLMVQPTQDRVNAAIHMFFMNYDIGVIWLNRDLAVVDSRYAKRWRPAYSPAHPAKYVLETHPDRIADFHIGDRLVIERCGK